MKKQSFLFLLLLSFLTIVPAQAKEQVISLKDGSKIRGELVGVSNGEYTISTATMGAVKIKSDQVVNISTGAVKAADTSFRPALTNNSSELNQKIQSTQNKIMTDPQMMKDVMEMTNDPELMKILMDPELTKAAMAHDVGAIENNPKLEKLKNNPKMQALIEKLRSK